MSKKTFLPLKIAPMQRIVAEPITDPAEQAALDKIRKRLKQKQAGQKRNRHGVKAAQWAESQEG